MTTKLDTSQILKKNTGAHNYYLKHIIVIGHPNDN
jgi:hypothetical protein